VARKKKKETRVASVDANGIFMREVKGTALWVIISLGIVSVLAVLKYTLL
jgi:hypothetical protein